MSENFNPKEFFRLEYEKLEQLDKNTPEYKIGVNTLFALEQASARFINLVKENNNILKIYQSLPVVSDDVKNNQYAQIMMEVASIIKTKTDILNIK